MNDKTTYLVTNDEPIKVTYSDQAAEFIEDSKPTTTRSLGRQLPTSKHAAGRTKPLSEDRKRRATNKMNKLHQTILTQEVDKRRLADG